MFTGKAIEYINEWDTQATGRPFFLYLAYTAPHDPLMAWPEDIAKYEGVYDVGYESIRTARSAAKDAKFCTVRMVELHHFIRLREIMTQLELGLVRQ